MNTTAQTPTLRLSDLNPDRNLQDALTRMEAKVRSAPESAQHRWALAELLCVLGHWERALKQLQTGAQLNDGKNADWQAKAQMLRGLVRAEAQRTQVFAGQLLPVPVIDRPRWMEDLAHAISANESGQHAQADRLRSSALETAPTSPGICTRITNPQVPESDQTGGPTSTSVDTAQALSEQPFEWISDSDTRLGPVCELMVAGGYRWVAYADIAELHLQPPGSLLDLVWLPTKLVLRSTEAATQTLHGYIPTRYSGTDNIAAQAGGSQRDALMLSHLTRWQNIGETGVFALGQKTLMTPQGDVPLLDIRSLHIGAQQ